MNRSIYRFSLAVIVVSLLSTGIPLFASETDDRIESYAKQTYVWKTYLQGEDIQLEARNGVVALTGTVSEESHKSLAREITADLPGVKSVVNKLEVKKEAASAANTDAWLDQQSEIHAFFPPERERRHN